MQREVVMAFRVTQDEAEAIRATAADLDRTRGDVIRLAVLGLARELRAKRLEKGAATAEAKREEV
jgi:hypothetical protein